MKNECLRLIGDGIMEYAKEPELALYKSYDGYKIWVDIKAKKFRVQMDGMEVEAESFSTAAMAIERGVGLKSHEEKK